MRKKERRGEGKRNINGEKGGGGEERRRTREEERGGGGKRRGMRSYMQNEMSSEMRREEK